MLTVLEEAIKEISILKLKTINTLTYNTDSPPCLAVVSSVGCQLQFSGRVCRNTFLVIELWRKEGFRVGRTLALGLIQQFTVDCPWMCCCDLFG